MQADVHGIKIGYDIYGDADTTLLLLHAFPLNRLQWSDTAAKISQAVKVRVVAMDLRGFGESSLAAGPTTMEVCASDVADLMGELGLETVILGGLSLGGYVAFRCIAEFPERIRGLILADTRSTADTPEQRQTREETAVFVEQQGASALIQRDEEKYFCDYTLRRQPEVVARAREIAALNPNAGVAAASRGMALRPDSTALLPQIGCPALVIVGEQDEITPIAQARTIFERIPDAQLEIVTSAGHLSNMEQPRGFAGAVARFLTNRFAVPPV